MLITTQCTALNKCPECKGKSYATKLLPERIMRKNQWTGQEEAVGIEESCVNCYNRNHGTEYRDKQFEKLAKEIRFKIFNRVNKEIDINEMKRIGRSQYNKLCYRSEQTEKKQKQERVQADVAN